MSEGQGGASAPAARSIIRSPKDFWGGLSLVLLAAFALWASSDLPGMRGFAFGPGTAPRLFAYSLMALGVGVMLVGLLTDGEPLERFTFTGTFGGAALVISLIPIYYFASAHRQDGCPASRRTSWLPRSARPRSWCSPSC